MNKTHYYLWTILNLLVCLCFIVANDFGKIAYWSAIPNLILAILYFGFSFKAPEVKNDLLNQKGKLE